MIVIEPPNTMGTGGLQRVNNLQLPQEFKVLDKNPRNNSLVILFIDDPNPCKAIQPSSEVGLVTSTIIYATRIAETIGEVRNKLNGSRMEIGWKELEHEGIGTFGHASVPRSVREITVTSGLLNWGNFIDELD